MDAKRFPPDRYVTLSHLFCFSFVWSECRRAGVWRRLRCLRLRRSVYVTYVVFDWVWGVGCPLS